MVLGGETTKTVASDISNLSLFKDVPEIYMYGMLCSVAVAGTWLLVATYWCLPVSTTHSISEYFLFPDNTNTHVNFQSARAKHDNEILPTPRKPRPPIP